MTDDIWFRPRRFGYGAGLPVSWQGWAVLFGFSAAVALAAMLSLPRHPWLFAALVLVATVPLAVLSARHTQGGWRWRWGGTA